MENSWNDAIIGERKDLAPIMEEEDKGMKGFLILFISISRQQNTEQLER